MVPRILRSIIMFCGGNSGLVWLVVRGTAAEEDSHTFGWSRAGVGYAELGSRRRAKGEW